MHLAPPPHWLSLSVSLFFYFFNIFFSPLGFPPPFTESSPSLIPSAPPWRARHRHRLGQRQRDDGETERALRLPTKYTVVFPLRSAPNLPCRFPCRPRAVLLAVSPRHHAANFLLGAPSPSPPPTSRLFFSPEDPFVESPLPRSRHTPFSVSSGLPLAPSAERRGAPC